MGKVQKTYYDKLISEVPDRNSNRVRVYRKENGEVVIHFRNFKLTLLTDEEITEWRDGMREALRAFEEGNYFPNDL